MHEDTKFPPGWLADVCEHAERTVADWPEGMKRTIQPERKDNAKTD